MRKRNAKQLLRATQADLGRLETRLARLTLGTVPYTHVAAKIDALKQEVAKLKTQC